MFPCAPKQFELLEIRGKPRKVRDAGKGSIVLAVWLAKPTEAAVSLVVTYSSAAAAFPERSFLFFIK